MNQQRRTVVDKDASGGGGSWIKWATVRAEPRSAASTGRMVIGTEVARDDSFVRACRCGHHGPPSSESEQSEQPPCSWLRSSNNSTPDSFAAAAPDGRQIASNSISPASSMQRTMPGPPIIIPERKIKHIGNGRNLRRHSFMITYYTAKSSNRQLNSLDSPVPSPPKHPCELAGTQDPSGTRGITRSRSASYVSRLVAYVRGGLVAFRRTPDSTIPGSTFDFQF